MDLTTKCFSVSGRTFYAKGIGREDNEVLIGYRNGDGTGALDYRGEFALRWHILSGEKVCRLEAFEDSWIALAAMPEFLAALSLLDNKTISVDDAVTILTSLGYVDETPYVETFDENAFRDLVLSRHDIEEDRRRFNALSDERLRACDMAIAKMEAMKEPE